MKFKILLIIFILIACNKSKNNITAKLDSLLSTYSKEIENHKVICIIPSDGCISCIEPFIEYSKKTDSRFLLVLSSPYKKSNVYIVESRKLRMSDILLDNSNLAFKSMLVSPTSPCLYFLKDGQVINTINLFNKTDNAEVFNYLDEFLFR